MGEEKKRLYCMVVILTYSEIAIMFMNISNFIVGNSKVLGDGDGDGGGGNGRWYLLSMNGVAVQV